MSTGTLRVLGGGVYLVGRSDRPQMRVKSPGARDYVGCSNFDVESEYDASTTPISALILDRDRKRSVGYKQFPQPYN